MKKLLLAALLAAATASANATVITFDGHSNTQFGDESTGNGLVKAVSDGYAFTSTGDHFHFIAYSPTNGTSSLLSDRSYSINMSKDGGGSFDLLNLMAYGNGGSALTVTGMFSGGGSISTSFAISNSNFTSRSFTGFTNLGSVVFSGANGGGFGLENVAVQDASAVPEPVSLALFGLGLAGLGLSRRRKA